MLAIIQSKIFCLPVSYQTTKLNIENCNLYGCETWSLTLRVEHRLRVSENRVLRRISGPKREDGWIVEKTS